jgi:hypothetical protein
MAQSSLDVARESIECFNADDFDRFSVASGRRLLRGGALHAATLRGGGCPGRGGTGLEASLPGWARHGNRGVRGRKHGRDRAHLGGHAERPDADARRSGATAVEPPRNGQGGPGDGDRGRQDQSDPPLLRPHDAPPANRRDGGGSSRYVASALSEPVEGPRLAAPHCCGRQHDYFSSAPPGSARINNG